MRPEPSLFRRLALRICLVLAFGAAILISAAWYYARMAADDAYDRLLLGAALQISENLTVESGAIVATLPTSAFQLLGLAESDRIFYRIVGPSNQTLTGYNDLKTKEALDKIQTKPVLETGTYKGEQVRIAIVPRTLSDPAVPGRVHIIVAQTTEARRAQAEKLTLQASLLVVVMSLVALAGAMLAIRYALQPLEELGMTLRRRDPRNLTPVNVPVPRELKPFVGSINHFMHRLNERVSLLQRFVADAAHQIRTPLTALSAQIDLLESEKLDASGRQHLERIQQRTSELAHLTNQLLSHAMVIHRADSVQLKPYNLIDVTRQAFRAAVPITLDPDIIVSFEAPDDDPIILADAVSLREAIVNVIDNALRHGTQSRLEVRVCMAEDQATVEVEDDGSGIPPDEWEHVTRRFESSKHSEGGSGLGFAIASEVLTAHGGRLRFREKEADRRGFTVILELPCLNAEEARYMRLASQAPFASQQS
ncbi:sensor histidine kinase [Microvirga sp. W0021]|uniref:histidine kinase n=1 Tax=Hohaiivirga grylli TaxID=3133970 RepID=A0ABV0BFP5_9HYPH